MGLLSPPQELSLFCTRAQDHFTLCMNGDRFGVALPVGYCGAAAVVHLQSAHQRAGHDGQIGPAERRPQIGVGR
jgi:hypothetical protein